MQYRTQSSTNTQCVSGIEAGECETPGKVKGLFFSPQIPEERVRAPQRMFYFISRNCGGKNSFSLQDLKKASSSSSKPNAH